MPSFLSRFFGDKKTQLYYLIEPKSSDALGPWAPEFAAYSEVVGYSSLGHIFLRDPERNDYAVLHPFKAAAKSYGEHCAGLIPTDTSIGGIHLDGKHDQETTKDV